MSSLRNSVQLIGHLGGDPEIKHLENGFKITRIRVATTDSYKTSTGEWKEETQWHSVCGWGNIAERMEKYLHKGSFVLIEGKLTYREFIDTTGVKKFFTEVRANSLMLLDKKTVEQQPSLAESNQIAENESNDGLPF